MYLFSFHQGASEALCYGTTDAPLYQSRVLIRGYFIQSLIDLFNTRLFMMSLHSSPLLWLPGSLAILIVTSVLQVTATTCPASLKSDTDLLSIVREYMPKVVIFDVVDEGDNADIEAAEITEDCD